MLGLRCGMDQASTSLLVQNQNFFILGKPLGEGTIFLFCVGISPSIMGFFFMTKFLGVMVIAAVIKRYP